MHGREQCVAKELDSCDDKNSLYEESGSVCEQCQYKPEIIDLLK